MSDDVQRRLIGDYGASPEIMARLESYVAMLIAANTAQNLIARSTEASIWERHILDSAQLHPLVHGRVADIGSGAGLPGVVLASFGSRVDLIEPRRKRAEFLAEALAALSLDSVIYPFHVERLTGVTFETIAARALAPLSDIFRSTIHIASAQTRWVLPKGRSGISELEVARRTWHGRFTTIPSITDPDAVIIVAEDVRPKV